MDFRSAKVFDYVTATKNLTEYEKKSKGLRLKWFRDYFWLCEKYRLLEKKLDELCDSYQTDDKGSSSSIDDDTRTSLPFPVTNNQNYGWLAKKSEFKLEKYGSLLQKYPHPMDEIVLLQSNVPTLALGKGFY